MKIKEAIEILTKHNEWRRNDNVPNDLLMQEPKQIGIAIDLAISELNKLIIPDVSGSLPSKSTDDISIYAAYDKNKWCASGYGIIKEPFDTPQEALQSILKERQ